VSSSSAPSPEQEAKRIVEAHVPHYAEIDRGALADAIRWAIMQGQITARQPLNVTPDQVPAIAYQIISFVEDYATTLHASSYCRVANELAACKRRVLALHGIEAPAIPRKPVASAASPVQKRKAARA